MRKSHAALCRHCAIVDQTRLRRPLRTTAQQEKRKQEKRRKRRRRENGIQGGATIASFLLLLYVCIDCSAYLPYHPMILDEYCFVPMCVPRAHPFSAQHGNCISSGETTRPLQISKAAAGSPSYVYLSMWKYSRSAKKKKLKEMEVSRVPEMMSSQIPSRAS
ncbi:uncharacterized protein LY79DRAFT_277747 [Colletotrichum navitas]|uniref:Uncharacterized protein n=1 Tax=Colletotrichum navitas TaxID=681940 RepID=A0AAD8V2N4_9PEZI|nr:uncharacterized protein LY79DRAFT_277747 [Colletotrichum navitas]KAK1585052.1 hypothetical protein LY79DRAFT_277747 [Colletotrichum navitas]